jgi:uncharacterized repeat protein (TIGR03803 family)
MRRVYFPLLALCAALTGPAAFCQTASESVLYNFSSNSPGSQLIQGWDGNYYGIGEDVPANCGVLYRITPAGEFSTVYTFPYDASCTAGRPFITQGPDGALYGTTYTGGPYVSNTNPSGYGTLFKITPSGVYTLLHNFGAPGANDGSNPDAALVLGSDGNFYGTTYNAGAGSIFRISPSGAFTPLMPSVSFSTGAGTLGSLLQASDGNFYGVTYSPGGGSGGVLFKLAVSGAGSGLSATLSSLYAFCYNGDCATQPQSANAGIIEGSDGAIYGTSYAGGSSAQGEAGAGTAYRVSLAGNMTTLYPFCPNYRQGAECSGVSPVAGLVQAGDGNFYGTTQLGGASGYGNVFALTPAGAFTDLHDFDGYGAGTMSVHDGAYPTSTLVPGSSGNLLGLTSAGGANGSETGQGGTLYSVAVNPAVPPPVQITLSSSSVAPGSSVTASFSVNNAFSLTMQQCYGFVTSNGVMTSLGKVPGTYSDSTKLYTGSVTFQPAPGTYNYALTCGGTESGYATLAVGYATETSLAAAPPTVAPPAKVSLQATVTRSQAQGDPTGSVSFYYGTDLLGSAKLNGSGVATLSASSKGVPAGQYSITAQYNGDAQDLPSSSPQVIVTVQ